MATVSSPEPQRLDPRQQGYHHQYRQQQSRRPMESSCPFCLHPLFSFLSYAFPLRMKMEGGEKKASSSPLSESTQTSPGTAPLGRFFFIRAFHLPKSASCSGCGRSLADDAAGFSGEGKSAFSGWLPMACAFAPSNTVMAVVPDSHRLPFSPGRLIGRRTPAIGLDLISNVI